MRVYWNLPSLVNNCTLTNLGVHANSITEEGSIKAFSKLLCDTTSINSTFQSNHTLSNLGRLGTSGASQSLLDLNLDRSNNKKEAAIIKILQHHNDFDMTPFFEWEFKVLPLVINWHEKASSITMPDNFKPNIGPGSSHVSINLFEVCLYYMWRLN